MSDWTTILTSILSSSVISGGVTVYATRRKTTAEVNKINADAASTLQSITTKAEEKAEKRYDLSAAAWDYDRDQLVNRIKQLRDQNQALRAEVDMCAAEHKKYER